MIRYPIPAGETRTEIEVSNLALYRHTRARIQRR